MVWQQLPLHRFRTCARRWFVCPEQEAGRVVAERGLGGLDGRGRGRGRGRVGAQEFRVDGRSVGVGVAVAGAAWVRDENLAEGECNVGMANFC